MEISGRRRFLELSDRQIWPDGMTVDDEGGLWVALGRAGAVRRYRADGALDGAMGLPTTNPTSLAFGGATAAISTSRPRGWTASSRATSRSPGRSSAAVRGDGPPGHAVQAPHTTSGESGHHVIERIVLFGASGDLTAGC